MLPMKKKTQSSKEAGKGSNKASGKVSNNRSILWLLVATIFFLSLDQLSKFLAMKCLDVSLNEGVAFGVEIGRFFTIALTFVLIIFLLKVILNEFDLSKWYTKVISAMVLGGAIGNLIDRIYLGHVIDFIKLPYWPTFNLADVFIVLGVILGSLLYKKLSLK